MSATRRPTSSRRRLIVLGLLLVVLVPSAVLVGPRVAYVVRKALRPPDTVIVPRETSVMFTLNLERLRGTRIWADFLSYMKTASDAEVAFKNLAQGTGFNPLEDVNTAVGAFPMLDVGTGGEFGVILHGKQFKAERLEAWSRAELAKENKELMSRDYKGHKLLWDSSKPHPLGTFYSHGTVLFGGDKWIEQMIDLEARPASAPPDAVIPLLGKVKRDWIFWGAGLVPEYVREKIKTDGNFPTAASMTAAYLSVEIDAGVQAIGGVLLASEQDAVTLVTQLKSLHDVIRGSDQVQAAGLVPVFDAIKFDTKGLEVSVNINLPQARVDDLFDRVKALLSQPPKVLPSQLPPQSGAFPKMPFLNPENIPGFRDLAPGRLPAQPGAPSPAAPTAP